MGKFGYFLLASFALSVSLLFTMGPLDIISYAVQTIIKIEYLIGDLWGAIELKQEYDFIIVGAGTAGCVLANRLSENPQWNVLLIEAGYEENILMDIPTFGHFLQLSDITDWQYKTVRNKNQFCLGMENNQCKFSRGKVMGGSSVLNYMIYTRGNRRDFDEWAKMGNEGWSYDDVLPYFRKVENSTVPQLDQDEPRGGGAVTLSYGSYFSEAGQAFLAAIKELGIKTINYNGKEQAGVSRVQTNIKNGYRVSANRAYIDPVRARPNLHIKTKSLVTRVVIDKNKRAVGIEFSNHNKLTHVQVTKEVILSAGAINSPQLLMLSGVGPAAHLRKKYIKTIVDSPFVGHNLMDHVTPGIYTFTTNASTPKQEATEASNILKYFKDGSGPVSSPAGCEIIMFADSNNFTKHNVYPDVELMQIAGGIHEFSAIKANFGFRRVISENLYLAPKNPDQNVFSVATITLRPRSRGHIELNNNDPHRHPRIYPNYFSDPYDLETVVRAIKYIHELEETKAFQRVNAKLVKSTVPACASLGYGSDRFWECHARHLTLTSYHYTGTCKMGPANDETAVVDSTLKVIGVNGLRVIDGSVMPEIVSGHPNSAILMIGEKGADMVKADWMGR